MESPKRNGTHLHFWRFVITARPGQIGQSLRKNSKPRPPKQTWHSGRRSPRPPASLKYMDHQRDHDPWIQSLTYFLWAPPSFSFWVEAFFFPHRLGLVPAFSAVGGYHSVQIHSYVFFLPGKAMHILSISVVHRCLSFWTNTLKKTFQGSTQATIYFAN